MNNIPNAATLDFQRKASQVRSYRRAILKVQSYLWSQCLVARGGQIIEATPISLP